MKKISILIAFIFIVTISSAQDFKADIATARTSYSANKLEDAHFALQQALSELDIVIGKEVLKLLPAKMGDASVNTKDDHVSSNIGYVGATVHRTYATPTKVQVEVISNSPLVATLNAFLNAPLLGGMMRDENNKNVKIQGYKARLERQTGSDDAKFNYTIQVPFNNALMTFTVNDSKEDEVMKMINTLPLQQIAKLVE